MSKELNNAEVVQTCTQRLTALGKFVKTTKTAMKVNGELVKLSNLTSIYQSAIDTRAALITQRAAFDKALAARDSAEATRQATEKALKVWVFNEFGAGSPEAHEFGFLPPKTGATSVAKKAKAVEQSLATRKARGTMGKRQKENIKGTIPVLTAPADPATTVQAAAPAANTTNTTTLATPTNGAATSLNGASSQH